MKIKNSKIGIGILVGVLLGVLIGGQPLDGALAAGICIGGIAIIAENMLKKRIIWKR